MYVFHDSSLMNLTYGSLPILGISSYVSSIKPGRFRKVLRNLHYPAIVLNTTTMLLVFALLPMDTILSGANVLSALAEIVSAQ